MEDKRLNQNAVEGRPMKERAKKWRKMSEKISAFLDDLQRPRTLSDEERDALSSAAGLLLDAAAAAESSAGRGK